MSIVHVTNEQRLALSHHSADAERIASTTRSETAPRIAWMAKCAALLHMIDPNAGQLGYGIIAHLYSDLSQALHRFRTASSTDDIWVNVDSQFQAAHATLDALITAIDIAPHSIITARDSLRAVNPYFFNVRVDQQPDQVFVLMPFAEEWSDRIWTSHIKPIVEGIELEPPLTCRRADDLYGHDVMHDIVSAICGSRAVIADITNRNANVFYELGIAHWVGRPVVLLTQTVDDIPFDLLRFRHVIYQDNSDGYGVLREKLRAALLEMMSV